MKGRTETLRHVLELLLEGQLVKLFAKCELAVDALLRDVEVLHVEESIIPNGLDKLLGKLLLPLGRSILAEVERHKVRPVKVFLPNGKRRQ